MSVRTRVYDIDGLQVMVEDFADGSQTIAVRTSSSASWGPKRRPIMDDDGDHIRTDEHRIVSEPTISDDDYAAYLSEKNL